MIFEDEPIARKVLQEIVVEIDFPELKGRAESPLKACHYYMTCNESKPMEKLGRVYLLGYFFLHLKIQERLKQVYWYRENGR
jgi:hypothetical protein